MGWIFYVTTPKGKSEIFAVGPNFDAGLRSIAREKRLHGSKYLAKLNGNRWWTFWKRKRGRIRYR
jgi:hypothetical protein